MKYIRNYKSDFTGSLSSMSSPFSIEACREQMKSKGYLLLRNFFDLAAMRDLRKEMLDVLYQFGCIDSTDPEKYKIIEKPISNVVPEFKELFNKIASIEGLHQLLHNKKLKEFLDDYYSEESFVMPSIFPRVVSPTSEGVAWIASTPHQDYYFVQGDERFVSLWVPLDDCPNEVGPLRLLPKSHLNGLTPSRISDAGGLETISSEDTIWSASDMKLSDVLIFSSYTIHSGTQNISNRLRLSVDFRAQPLSGEISSISIPSSFMWAPIDQVYQEFKNEELKYYWKKYNLKIVPHDEELWQSSQMDFYEAKRHLDSGDNRVIPFIYQMMLHGGSEEIKEGAKSIISKLGINSPEDFPVIANSN